MASVCPNAASTQVNYAGPMPIIGLYIAAATAVCFLLILIDVVFAYLQNKPWIPVHFFSLNSFTFTVMGVSTKLSVDLTTYMPGLDAQLSKLCSSVFICISMGFFMPSLGTMKGSDRYTNLTSLTILVLTIIVNVCMQINTGVIFSFVAEHIVILVFMFILHWACWSSSLDIDHVLLSSALYCKKNFKESILVNGKFDELDGCYRRSYICNPQVLMCEYSHCTTIGLLSFLSFVILLQAILRSTVLGEFQICMEYSDYKWSIWVVVAAQFLTCALAGLSITWRWISIAFHMEPNNKFSIKVRGEGFTNWKVFTILTSDWDIYFIYMAVKKLGSGALKCFIFLQSLVFYLHFGTKVLLNFIDELVLFVIHKLRISFSNAPTEELDDEFDDLGRDEYKEELRKCLMSKSKEDLKRWKEKNESNLSQLIYTPYEHNKELRKWLVRKSGEDLKRWKNKNESKLVSELCHSMLPYPPNDLLQKMDKEKINKCHLLVLVLLYAKVVLPSNKVNSLLKAFDQVFQVICFVHEFLYSNSLDNMLELRLAQDMWMTRDVDSGIFYKNIIKPALQMFPAIPADEESQPLEFQRALNIFEKMLKLVSYIYNITCEEILPHASELNTIDGIYTAIKQFVLSIMHFYLSSFPTVIYQYIMDSPMDEIEARTKLTVKLYSKLEGLEDKVSWQPLHVRPQAATPSEIPVEVPTRDQRSDEVAELSEALVETTITEEITKIC